jgi:hypothetical protein
MPRLSFVGVHLFAHGLDHHETFGPVVAQLTHAVAAHKQAQPDADFALLPHRASTLLHRLQARFFAPRCGLDRLTAFDTHAHPLATLLGRGYHSSTLRQFLGQRERVGAAEVLLPALVPAPTGPITSVDGHMVASWSRMSMHKGTITLLGRIMAGSQAVMAHDDAGQAVFVAYDPPDIPLAQVMVAYCQRVALATGTSRFVIDRAVNAVALAAAFDEQGLGVLCLLDDNEQAGLESFAATDVATLEDGTRVESGPWKEARPEDPRHFVIVQAAEGKTLVSWGTPQVQDALEAQEWPGVSRERNESQEHRFKDMIDHGARNTNYGRQTLRGADRQQQRKQAHLDQSLETAHKRVDKQAAALKAQQDKVAESASNRPWQTSGAAQAHRADLGTSMQGGHSDTGAGLCASRDLGPRWAAGRSGLPQADHHDHPHPIAGALAAG